VGGASCGKRKEMRLPALKIPIKLADKLITTIARLGKGFREPNSGRGQQEKK
jgi:hypothetical protein